MSSVGGAFVRGILQRALPQAIVIIIVGAAVGFALNQTRVDPLPIDLPEPLLLTESGARAVFLGEARQLFDEADYIFVDARTKEQFVLEHVEDAFCLPLEEFVPLYHELQVWTAGQPLVVYSSMRDIGLADDLARRLLEAGEEEVLILADGIEGWSERGYPLASGTDGLLDEEYDDDFGTDYEEGDGVDEYDEEEGRP